MRARYQLAAALAVAAAVAGVIQAVDSDWRSSPTVEAADSRSTTTSSSPSTTAEPTTTTTTAPTTTTTVDPHTLSPPDPATDPTGLAKQIGEAEAVLRDPASSDGAVARAALAQQVAYRQLGSHPEWDAAVLAAVPAGLRSIVELHAAARREFRAMHGTLPTTLPAWKIVAPDPREALMAAYQEAEATFGVPWKYLAAIHLVETGTGRIRGTSVAGAQGPMQFMPATWAAYGGGGDINDTRDAIFGAARYLAANNAANDIDHALYRYNHSDRYVRGVKIYADLIAEHPGSARAFYHWGVWYLTEQGQVYLPVGYHETEPVPVAEYLAR